MSASDVSYAIALAQAGWEAQALVWLTDALTTNPYDAGAWTWYGNLVPLKEEKVKAVNNVLAMDPQSSWARSTAANLGLVINDPIPVGLPVSQPQRVLDTAIELANGSRANEAEPIFAALLRSDFRHLQDVALWKWYAIVAYSEEERQRALDAIKRLDPSDEWATFELTDLEKHRRKSERLVMEQMQKAVSEYLDKLEEQKQRTEADEAKERPDETKKQSVQAPKSSAEKQDMVMLKELYRSGLDKKWHDAVNAATSPRELMDILKLGQAMDEPKQAADEKQPPPPPRTVSPPPSVPGTSAGGSAPGEFLGHARYWDGHYKLGSKTIPGRFMAYPAYLAFEADGEELLAVPWSNIVGLPGVTVPKKLGGQLIKNLAWGIPGVSSTRLGNTYLRGFALKYRDEETGRDMSPRFVVDNEHRRNAIRDGIMYRSDSFSAGVNR